MSITGEVAMRDFNLDMVEILEETKNTLVIRTADLLPTLLHLQKCWRKLWDLLPDDEEWIEREILTFYKPKSWNTKNS
jgi:hypothetical protein